MEGWMDGSKVGSLSSPPVSVNSPLVFTCFSLAVLVGDYRECVCALKCSYCVLVNVYLGICVSVCISVCMHGSPRACRAVQSGVLSSRARLHTNTM